MFGKAGKFLAKRVLPLIAANLNWKVKKVEKKDGFYMWFFVSVFGFALLDEEVKFSDQTTKSITKNEVLQMQYPVQIDTTLPGEHEKLKAKKLNNYD